MGPLLSCGIQGASRLRLAICVDPIEMLMRAAHDTAFDWRRSATQHRVQCAPAPVCLDWVKLYFRTILIADDAHGASLCVFVRAGNAFNED